MRTSEVVDMTIIGIPDQEQLQQHGVAIFMKIFNSPEKQDVSIYTIAFFCATCQTTIRSAYNSCRVCLYFHQTKFCAKCCHYGRTKMLAEMQQLVTDETQQNTYQKGALLQQNVPSRSKTTQDYCD